MSMSRDTSIKPIGWAISKRRARSIYRTLLSNNLQLIMETWRNFLPTFNRMVKSYLLNVVTLYLNKNRYTFVLFV